PQELCLGDLRMQPLPGTGLALPRLAPPFELLFTLLHTFREGWLEQSVNSGLEVDLTKFADIVQLFRAERSAILDGGFRELVDRFNLREPVLWVLEHLDRTLDTGIVAALG